MTLWREIREAVKGLYSLAVGMKITGKEFAKPWITTRYPWKTVDNLSTYFGHVELVPGAEDPGETSCIACGICAKNCPSSAITVKAAPSVEEPAAEGEKKKKARKKPGVFLVDFSLCSLCGQCVEGCPQDALRFSRHVYWAVMDRKNLTVDLLDRLAKAGGAKAGGNAGLPDA